jgi:hypothetical protein
MVSISTVYLLRLQPRPEWLVEERSEERRPRVQRGSNSPDAAPDGVCGCISATRAAEANDFGLRHRASVPGWH